MPAASPRAFVVVMHGLGSRFEYFEPLGIRLAEEGIGVAGWNARGQGLDPVVARRGAGLNVGAMLEDLADFLVFIQSKHPGIPLFLAGDSMGAQLALVALASPGVKVVGALLYVPVVALRQRNPAWIRSVLGFAGLCFPALRLSPNWFVNRGPDAIPLSRVPERQRELAEAPYRLHQFSLQFLSDMGVLIGRAAESGSKIRVPVAVFSAGVDLFITTEQISRFVELLETDGTSHFHYPEAHHDILHDYVQSDVLRDSIAWLEARLG